MSKEAALTMLTGQPVTAPVNPSLVTGEIPKVEASQTAEAPTIAETAPSETTSAEPTNLDAGRLAIFTKKEAALRKEREEFKKERESYLNEKKQVDEFLKRVSQFDEIAKSDKMAALKLIGWSDEDILNIIAQAEETPKDPIEEARKIAAEETKKLRDELAKEKADLETQKNQQVIAKLRTDIKDTIAANAEKYEIAAWRGAEAHEQVYEVIVENLKENNELLSVDEALAIVEEYYEEEAKQIQALKKFQAQTQQAEPPKLNGEAPKSNTPQPQSKPKTLTNAATATSTAAIPRRETPAEKKERLVRALMNGGL